MNLLVDEYAQELEYYNYTKDILKKSKARIENLALAICLEAVGVTADDFKSPSRKRPLPELRVITFMLLWKQFKLTYNETIDIIGKDRSMSYIYQQKHLNYYNIDKIYTKKYDESLKKLKSWID